MAQIGRGASGESGGSGRRIGLVATAQRRRGGVRQAREQYAPSPTFRRARDYCERAYGEWYILSASHLVLPPQQVIGPDDGQLRAFTPEERLAWAAQVAERLRERRDRSAGDRWTFTITYSGNTRLRSASATGSFTVETDRTTPARRGRRARQT